MNQALESIIFEWRSVSFQALVLQSASKVQCYSYIRLTLRIRLSVSWSFFCIQKSFSKWIIFYLQARHFLVLIRCHRYELCLGETIVRRQNFRSCRCAIGPTVEHSTKKNRHSRTLFVTASNPTRKPTDVRLHFTISSWLADSSCSRRRVCQSAHQLDRSPAPPEVSSSTADDV